MKYTKVPENTRQNLQMNAGIIVNGFNPSTGEIESIVGVYSEDILGATSGGMNFVATPQMSDLFEDVDNMPAKTKQGQMLTYWDVTASGTFVSVTRELAKRLMAAADFDEGIEYKIIPRSDILETDFQDLWWIGDYSDVNTGENAGFIAIHIMNALSTNGFQIQSGKDVKGQFSFNFSAYYDLENIEQVPFEVYIRTGGAETGGSITLNTHSIRLTEGDTITLIAKTVPSGETVTWTSADTDVATVTSGGVVEAIGAGNTIISAAMTVEGVTYNDTCTVIVVAEDTGA